MPCNTCSRKYGFFLQEYRCSNCELSFCKKCLRNQIEVPRRNNYVLHVCLICFDKLMEAKRRKIERIKNAKRPIKRKLEEYLCSRPVKRKLENSKMSCNACTKKYGFFCKESGCPNCGYSFCTKCLKKEIEVPRCKNSKLKVCLKCFEKLENEKLRSTVKVSKKHPIENNIFSIEEPIDAPILEPTHPVKLTTQITSENDKIINENLDSVITKRLAGLKNVDPITLPNDTEMASRLALLKGIPFKEYSKSDILLSTDTRTDQDKINDLLKQFVEEKNIDDSTVKYDESAIKEIEKRLASLRNNNDKLDSEGASALPRVTTEDDIKQIVQKYMDEAKLPQISPEEKEIIEDLPKPTVDTEELPWCTICNEDAVLRCIGCDGDLFCSNCYKVCHDDEDFREHKAQTYSKPPQFKENHF